MKKSIYAAALILAAVCLTGCQGGGGTGGGVTQQQGAPSQASEGTTQETQTAGVDLEKVHQAVKDAYGDQYIPNEPYSAQDLNDIFGVASDLHDEFIAEGPTMSVHVDTFLAIHCKAGKGEKVEKVLNDYRTGLVEDSMQYPMNMSKVEASRVIRHGDYVFFILLGTPSMEAQEQGEEADLASAKEENQKAVDAIDGFFKR